MKRNILKFIFILCTIPLNVPVYASDEGYINYNNHPEIVDLGLSICWADRNVGANSPEEPGGQYLFSDTIGYGNGDSDVFETRGTKYDVARVKWGGAWRLPTPEEIKELLDGCTIEYTQNGAIFTGPNGNSIFLPLPTSPYSSADKVTYLNDERGEESLCYYEFLNNFKLESSRYDYCFVRPVINRAKDGTIINDYPNPSEDSYNAISDLYSSNYKNEHYIIDNIEYTREVKYGEYNRIKITGINSNGINIKSIKIPKRVYISNRWEDVFHIAPDAFDQCPSIETFDTEWSNFQCIDGVLYDSYKRSIIAIAPGKKGTIKVEDGVKSLQFKYYRNLPLIDKIIIPSSVSELFAFNNFENLTSIEVSEDNPNFCCIDGVLFSKDKTELLRYLPIKPEEEYTIPTSVKKIGIRAFLDCENLKKVTISENVTEIGYYAFENCMNLTEIISMPLNPPICESSIENKNITLYVYYDALDAYEEAWGEGWKTIEILDPGSVILIIIICLVVLALVGFLGYKYLLPYIRQKQEEYKIKQEEKLQQKREQELSYQQLKRNKKMDERDLMYKQAVNKIFYGALAVLIFPVIEFCYTVYEIYDLLKNIRLENIKYLIDYFLNSSNDSDYIFCILLIVSYIIFFNGLTQLSKALKNDSDRDDVKKIRTGFMLFVIAELINFIPILGFFISVILYLIGYIMIIKGCGSLGRSIWLSEKARNGFKNIKIGYLLLLLTTIFTPILLLLFPIYYSAKIILPIIIIINWKRIKDSDPDIENYNEEVLVLKEQKSVEADAQMMEDMEQKSDDELQAIINSPNMYSAEAVATASTVYTLRNSDAIKEQLQAKQLGELQAIISNKHVYCEAYIELVKEVLTQKLN